MKRHIFLFCFMLCALLVNVNIETLFASEGTSEIIFEDKTVYYNGNEQGIYVVGLDSSIVVMYENNVGTEPNTYNATATFELNGETQELTATLIIKPAIIDNITLPTASFVYDGTKKSLSVNTLILPYGETATVEYSGNGQVNASSKAYVVTATVSHSFYETLNLSSELYITPKALTIEFEELTFDRTYQNLKYTLNGVISGDDANIELSQDTVFSAGNYTITATALNTNYSLSGQYMVVVNKATVSEDDISKPTLSITYFEGIRLKDVSLKNGFSWVDAEQEISCANKSFSAIYNLDSANYNDLTITLYVDIKKASINADFPSVSSVVYGEQLKNATFNNYHKLGEFKWENEMLYPIVNNSGYVMKLIPYDTVNYNIEQKVINIVVEPKVLSLEFDNYDRVVYNGLKQNNVTATIGGVLDFDTGAVQVKLSYSGNAINAGTYTVTASINNQNYTLPTKSVDFIIEKAPQVLDKVNYIVGGDKIIFDRSFVISLNDELSEGSELCGLNENEDYDITVYLKGDENYFDSNVVSIYFKTSFLVSSVNQAIEIVGDVDIGKYEVIASAIKMYNTLSDADKTLVDYETLSQKITQYNDLCKSINDDLSISADKSKNIWRNVLVSVGSVVSVLPLAFVNRRFV